MDRVFRAFSTCGLVAAACMVSAQAIAQTIPIDSFARDPQMQSPSLSPDGTQLAYITSHEGKPLVVVRNLTTKNLTPVVAGSNESFRVRRCWFKNNERILCSYRGIERIATQPVPVSRLVAINADGTKQKVLIQNGRAGGSQYQDQIVHGLPDDPSHVLIALTDNEDIFPSVYKLDVYTGSIRLVQQSRSPVLRWIADRSGVVRFGYGYRDTNALYVARDGADSPWRTLEKFKLFENSFSPLGYGPRASTLLVVAPHNGRDAVWEMDLSDQREMQLLFSHAEVDVDDSVDWPDGHVAGFSYETDKPQVHFIDPEAKAIVEALDILLPGRINRVIDGSKDGNQYLVLSYSDVQPAAYYVLGLSAKKLLKVGDLAPDLKDAKLAPMKPVTVPGPNGLRIPGYLTLPVGKDPKKLPTVVYPHGGPHARDSWSYDPVVQLLASRGYAVLQLNFRGSTGYGSEWYDAGFQHWGTVMHDDITAGARWLISEGVADPARMCIVGWSYGGYAALIGVVKEPELYRCAVSIAGVSDIYQLQRDDSRFYSGRAMVAEITGDNKKELDAVSPRKNAQRIKVPVLLVHGDDDVQVLVDHSYAMSKALKRAGVKNELVIVDGGDHSLSRQEWRKTLYTKLETFLGTQLGGT
jgi:dienelactone hydrolase